MAINFFDKAITKQCGSTNVVVCPVCSRATEMKLIESLDFSGLAPLLGKNSSEHFAVCPRCASVFSVKEEYVKFKNSGTFCILQSGDLDVLVKGNA